MPSVSKPTPSRRPVEGAALTRLQSDLVARIVETIRNEQPEPGRRFTELGLANHFGVSRSPVREALRHLAERGVLRFEEKRGFFLTCRPEDIDTHLKGLSPAPEEALYTRIVDDRVRRRLADSFAAPELMRRYGCSRTLLLRVLNRLTQEGVLRAGRGHAWSFVQLLHDPQAQEESYRLRMILEPAGLLEPTLDLDRQALERSLETQRQVVESGALAVTGREMFEINAAFHELLARCSGNRFFLQNMQQQNRIRRLTEYSAFADRARMVLSCQEHIAVIAALLNGDPSEAAKLLRAHLQGAVDYAEGDLPGGPTAVDE
ncbi:MAG: GntR family transcriptional regulator [Rhodospirillales bacterium]